MAYEVRLIRSYGRTRSCTDPIDFQDSIRVAANLSRNRKTPIGLVDYFCSSDCKTKFDLNPAQYAKK